MPFPRRLLTEGEDVVVELRPHWIVLSRPVLVAGLAVAMVVAIITLFPGAPIGVAYVLGVLVGIPSLWLALAILRWRSSVVVLTSYRIIQRTGVVVRHGTEIRLERLNEVSYRQSIGGRLIGEGQVAIEVGGEKGVVVLQHMRRPEALQSLITEQVSALGRGTWHGGVPASGGVARPTGYDYADQVLDTGPPTDPAGTRAGSTDPAVTRWAAPTEIAERLQALHDLYRRGVVTTTEYESKKAELLQRL